MDRDRPLTLVGDCVDALDGDSVSCTSWHIREYGIPESDLEEYLLIQVGYLHATIQGCPVSELDA
jgi:hypothetical protein